MQVRIEHDGWHINIDYNHDDGAMFWHGRWTIRKWTDAETLEPLPAEIEPSGWTRYNAKIAKLQAKRLQVAANIATRLDETIETRDDFAVITVREWPGCTRIGIAKHEGRILITIPPQQSPADTDGDGEVG